MGRKRTLGRRFGLPQFVSDLYRAVFRNDYKFLADYS